METPTPRDPEMEIRMFEQGGEVLASDLEFTPILHFRRPPIEDALMMAAVLGQLFGGGLPGGPPPPDFVPPHVRQEQDAARKRMRVDEEKRDTDAILDGCATEEAVADVSEANLRRVLAANLVPDPSLDMAGLVEAATRLWRGRPAQATDAGGIGLECKVCLSSSANCVFTDCGHLVTCVTCGQKVDTCPVCRVNITKAIRVFT